MVSTTRCALVFGGSGQVGRAVLARLRGAGWQVVAASREARTEPGTCWVRAELPGAGPVPGRYDAVLSCGPLDHFAEWHARHGVGVARVVAFGSTSVDAKQASPDAGERALAQRLAHAEASLQASAARQGAAVTVLRPTLVYGAGRDMTLTRIARLARRWGAFPLPRNATGLRQPVHVDDLGAAAVAALGAPATHGRAYALPGGETLPYREMVARVLTVLDPRPRLVPVPSAAFRVAVALARPAGLARGFGPGAAARLHEDLVFDAGPAARDFGYAPRGFVPIAATFRPAA